MGKKRRNKKNNQLKQGPHNDYNPRNSLRFSDMADFIMSSLHNDNILQQITPLDEWNHQVKEHDPDNSANNNMDPNDFISRLPKDILSKIISLLPFVSAVRTTLLSTSWKDLWKEALLPSVRHCSMEDAVTAISSFLDDFDILHRPRNKWGLKFEFSYGRILLVAISPKNTLQLDFSAGKQEFPRPFDWLLRLKYPSSPRNRPIFRYNWFADLLEEDHDPLHTQQPSLNAIKVKSLYLISVSNLSQEIVSSLVSNLSLLESLTIAKCYGLQSLQIKGVRGLHKLVVLDCPQLGSICFEGSRLSSFQYRGRLVSFEFKARYWFWTVRPLDDAMLDFRLGPPMCDSIKYDGLKSIVKSIKNVKSLTLCRWVFEALIYWMLSRDSESLFNGLRELWWIDCSMDRDNVNALLTFLKFCPNLERLYMTIDPKSYNMGSTKKLSVNVKDLDKLAHLELLKLEGFANENQEIFFAKQLTPLFRNRMRPLILVTSNGACFQCLKVPKLEKKGKYPYKFIEVKETYPNHVHMKL